MTTERLRTVRYLFKRRKKCNSDPPPPEEDLMMGMPGDSGLIFEPWLGELGEMESSSSSGGGDPAYYAAGCAEQIAYLSRGISSACLPPIVQEGRKSSSNVLSGVYLLPPGPTISSAWGGCWRSTRILPLPPHSVIFTREILGSECGTLRINCIST